MTSQTIADLKKRLRSEALARRSALPHDLRGLFSRRLVEEGMEFAQRLRPAAVSAFYPIRNEPDTLALLDALANAGFVTALPFTATRAMPLVFRRWRPGDPTVPGELSIPEPSPEAKEVEPDLMFVPLACFDRRGHRIGFGAGHYDRSLASLRSRKPICAIGVAYATSEVAEVPDLPHDEKMDFILTETELIEAGGGRLMRLLFIGDIVGRSGRAVLLDNLPGLRARWKLDFVVVNGENAAGGFGITEAICEEFLAAGADAITLGNHSFDQREALVFIERQPRLIRPANYPPGTPGRGANSIEAHNGARVLVVNMMGRVFMDALDDPFARIDQELNACPLGQACDASIIDFHAEATSEKQAFGHYIDGRVSLSVGTHTHVPTADARILSGGTGFITEVGMTGDYDSVIGMDKEEPVRRFIRKLPSSRFEPANGPATLCGVALETGPDGLARKIAPVRIGGKISQAAPDFWAA